MDQRLAREDAPRFFGRDRPVVHDAGSPPAPGRASSTRSRATTSSRASSQSGSRYSRFSRCARRRLDPHGLDLGDAAREHARRLDDVRGHDPARLAPPQRRARKNMKADAARAEIVALLAAHADHRAKARQQRAMHPGVARRPALAPQADLGRAVRDLRVDVLPFATGAGATAPAPCTSGAARAADLRAPAGRRATASPAR